jgi:adenylate cyclase
MTYRRQLFLVLVALALVSTGMFAVASYRICNHLLRREVHRKVHSIAATAVLFLDPSDIAAIRAPRDTADPAYQRLLKVLTGIRDANRRQDVRVEHVWTLLPASGNLTGPVYGVDTGTGSIPPHPPGSPFEVAGKPVTASLEQIHKLDNQLDHFQFAYDYAFAPIYDASGRLVAELGIKLGWAPNTMLGNVAYYLLPPFLITIALALILAIVLSRGVTVHLNRLRITVDQIGSGNLGINLEPRGTVEFADLARAINSMAAGLRERETISKAFSGYLSREVLDMIVRDGHTPELKGERKDVSVLFADLRNFTAMAETTSPEEVVNLLCMFFERMVEVVHRNDGRVDKFLGDGLMATFGAPVEDSSHREHAIITALEMQRELRDLCAKWQAEGRPSDFRMGIGINSGSAVVGNIGSEAHMEYTVIGDTVNLASRLQTATKEIDAEILVSESTQAGTQSRFRWKPLGGVHVKGRVQEVEVFGVEGVTAS